MITAASSEPIPVGFVYENGAFHDVERVTFNSRIGDDGHTPLGCDARIWTKTGHGYHILGETGSATDEQARAADDLVSALRAYLK